MTADGERVRLVPGLDGSLYQMDRNSVSPLPISADTLLSSSYRIAEDTIFSGQ